MEDGFIRMAAATPKIRVADPAYNRERIAEIVREAAKNQAKVIVFPELCLTGYTCGDLFLQTPLLDGAKTRLAELAFETARYGLICFAGLPWEHNGKLYNVIAALSQGKVLGLIPKTFIPNYSEFYEARHFTPGHRTPVETAVRDRDGREYMAPFGTDLLFCCRQMPELVIGGEVCEDVWMPDSPSIRHAAAGALTIVNASASDETTGKDRYRESLVSGQSAKLVCAYLYASAGEGESTTDLVFGGHNLIVENGTVLAQSARFMNETIYADVDLERLRSERRRMTCFTVSAGTAYRRVYFDLEREHLELRRFIDPAPFVPDSQADREKRCEEIMALQAMGLKKRLEHTRCTSAVAGISGGLDSTLALLVTAKAFDMLDISRENIQAVTMPCFGTTDRTYGNACALARRLGTSLREIRIEEAVTGHFKDIGQDPEIHDVTYENSQARERTQILMDLANQQNGIVIGTGDMSELALGWATYNGDHMSMYGVNVSIPKTLVRHLVGYYAGICKDQKLSDILYDILDTPVSPELLPPENGAIAQKTEDLVGPYQLHDFFLYHMLRFGYHPKKICRMAKKAFNGRYDERTIGKWLKVFYRRFFSQQFKRSCLPDGPKVGSVALSPRGDLRMPSDACSRLWMEELEEIPE